MTKQLSMNLRTPPASAISPLSHKLIRSTIKSVAMKHKQFTSEHVYNALPDGVKQVLQLHPNALGSSMRAAAVDGIIEDTGTMCRAEHAAAHRRKITVWRIRDV